MKMPGMKKLLIACLMFSLAGQLTAAHFDMTPAYSKAYLEILRLRFGTACSIMNHEKEKDPSNVADAYLMAYLDFLKTLISEEDQNYATLQKNKIVRIKKIESVSSISPWRLYALGQLNLQSGMASAKTGDFVKAALDIKKAYSQFSENQRRFPAFKPNKAGMGLLHVLLGTIPESYRWITGLFGMEGDVKEGLSELQSLLTSVSTDNEYPYLYNECIFITTFITFNLTITDDSEASMLHVLENDKTSREIKNNPLLIYAVASFYSNRGMNDKALALLSGRPLDNSYYEFHYLDYLTGVTLLNKLDKSARIYFLKYITNFKGKNFIKASYQRLAWSYLIDGDFAGYKKFISRVKLFGDDKMDNDREALNEANRNTIPDLRLLKVRLLFDGGYYEPAEKLLNQLSPITLSEQGNVEYLYRTARINHKKGDLLKAKHLYYETYTKGKAFTTYYAANSMLNLGNIYEQERNSRQALWCYKQCFILDFNEYHNSITQKAKAGINRLSVKH
jgi:hypothetical protein